MVKTEILIKAIKMDLGTQRKNSNYGTEFLTIPWDEIEKHFPDSIKIICTPRHEVIAGIQQRNRAEYMAGLGRS